MPIGPEWTARENAILRELWDMGATVNQIARATGRSRNAVVSRGRKMKLTPRPSPIRRRPKPGTALADLGKTDCRFAVTAHDAGPRDHRFCGKPVAPGTSWCTAHAKKVGLTAEDLKRYEDRAMKARAHADVRSKRAMLDFAPHYVIGRRDGALVS